MNGELSLEPTARDLAASGLRPAELERVRQLLGRMPNRIELAMFGVMWSEHCAYKHSRALLRTLPSESPHVLAGPGGNAGVVEVAPGIAAALKVESHNHPSAVDPFHGAATGVGGIIRDVLAMGARPIALLDALRFGPPHEPRARRLRDGVIAGIAFYGNAIGVPTVGGEIDHAPCWTDNPLVNVACLGVAPVEALASAAAREPGSVVLYAGARTGRDGIGGAAFASEELDEHSAERDRSAVQIGDPFAGKLLIEATLQALATGGVRALQDMGAAGLTCATAEMSAAGGTGMEIDLDRVPRREADMSPLELVLSESQERMLLVVAPERADAIAAIYRRWGLVAAPIGTVIAEPVLRMRAGGRLVVELPPACLANGPVYALAPQEPAARRARRAMEVDGGARFASVRGARAIGAGGAGLIASAEAASGAPDEALQALRRAWLALLAHPTVASKRWVYRQYDHMVQLRTVLAPGAAGAAVLRLLEAPPRGLALAIDGNARYAWLDPWAGGALAVCEAALNVACTGARPLALTDGLNLGNPERPEGAWELAGVIEGIGAACRALGIPVVGGNVSLYNESSGAPIWPTPICCVLGVLDDVGRALPSAVREPGDAVVLLGSPQASLGGALFLEAVAGEPLPAGQPLRPDFALHARLLALLAEAAAAGELRSAHDLAEGGLGVALAEAALLGERGLACALPPPAQHEPLEVALFGEGPSRVLASVPPACYDALSARCAAHAVPLVRLGEVTAEPRLRLRTPAGELECDLAALRAAWQSEERTR
ncbi:MAG: phosphoribosylformylglycinamidine synthase subunit PurL [Planctomycetota bacterium]|nr:MAG: phosphoribosylformylglycinamidine synthase subunit PurL [Planctomycetota bacterium]